MSNLNYYPCSLRFYQSKEYRAYQSKYGHQGTGYFHALQALIADEDGCWLGLSDEITIETLTGDIGMSEAGLKDFLDALENKYKFLVRKGNSISTPAIQEALSEEAEGERATDDGSLVHDLK